jgi:rhomboid protease GluP
MANCVQCGRQLPGLTFGKKLCQWCVQHEAAKRGEDSPIQRVETAPWKRSQSSSQSSSMIVTQVIIAINVVVFVAMSMAVGVTLLGSPEWLALSFRLGSNFPPYTLAGEWWRLLTSVFLHGGLLHIAFNMWCLWNLGRLAESVYGHWTYAAVYLITGISASLVSAGWHLSAANARLFGGSVGASGAIFGIAGALLASFYLGEFSLPRSVITGMLRSVATFVGYNLFFGAVVSVTDNAAHIGGLLMGLVLGALIAKVAPDPTAIGRRIGVLLIGVALAFGGAVWLSRSAGSMIHTPNGGKRLSGQASNRSATKLNPNGPDGHFELAQALTEK